MMKDPIKEMARDLCECFDIDGTCYYDNKPCDFKCEEFTNAQYLYEKGYCKKSVVVEEVFQNILQILADADLKYETASEEGNPVVNYIFEAVMDLQKKYKGGSADEKKQAETVSELQ